MSAIVTHNMFKGKWYGLVTLDEGKSRGEVSGSLIHVFSWYNYAYTNHNTEMEIAGLVLSIARLILVCLMN